VTKCYTLITSTFFSYPIFIHDTSLVIQSISVHSTW